MAAKVVELKMPSEVAQRIKQMKDELRAARRVVVEKKRDSDRIGRETDKTLARIERRLSD